MEKNIIKMMLLLIIIIIVIIVFIIFKINNKENGPKVKIDEYTIEESREFELSDEELNVKSGEVKNINTFKTIENCLSGYYNIINNNASIYYNRNSNSEKNISDEDIKKNQLLLISEEYINNHSINTSNFQQFIKTYDEQVIPICIKMEVNISNPIEKYLVYGILINQDYKFLNDFYIYVNIDTNNNTFSVEPINENLEDIENINIINKNQTIEKNELNSYKDIYMDDEMTINYYISRFKQIALSNPEKAYNYIEDGYKMKKFNNLSQFQNYIKNNYTRIKKSNITKYLNYTEGENTYFICVDQNNYYYIFKQIGFQSIEYFVRLDDYTIDSDRFTEKYDKANDQQKIGMNIEKIVSAVNCKDYEYIYSKLDDTFKQNNYKTINILEETINNNLFDINKAEYKAFNEVGDGIYTYNIQIHPLDNETNNKNMTIVMKLLENRDFVMSFSFD